MLLGQKNSILLGLLFVTSTINAAIVTSSFPVGSTTISCQINSTNDDVEEEGPDGTSPGTIYVNSTDLEFVYDPNSSQGTQIVGMRFNNLNIPQGAAITAAYITFTSDSPDVGNPSNSSATTVSIAGQDIDNAPVFSTTNLNVSSRTKTTASVNWSPTSWTTGTTYNTSSIATIIKEIVDRPGWTSGNSMAMIVTGTNIGGRVAHSYDGVPGSAPILYVTYTVAEICNDGLDNDGDGLIDCEDLDCNGSLVCPDNDNDGINDAIDLDDDNDGITDLLEDSEEILLILENKPTTVNGSPISSVTALSVGDEIRIRNTSQLSNGRNLEVIITVDAMTCPGAEYDPSNAMVSTLNADPSLDEHVIVSLLIKDENTGEQISFGGNVLFRDIDSNGGNDYSEVVGVYGAPNLELGDNLMIYSGAPLSGYLYASLDPTTSGNPLDWTDEINISGSNQDHWATYFFEDQDSLKLYLGLSGSATGSGTRDFILSSINVREHIDFDKDGVVDSKDLDSDNDGIFDLIEAGHGQSDADMDGVIDGVTSQFGSNGLFDNIETSPDSGVLNYSLQDSDSDSAIDAKDLDSDGDGCYDVLEAGFTDDDDDGQLGPSPIIVDVDGLVTSGSDGYSGTNGFVLDPAQQSGCPDQDGDFISDIYDLDDDNDGLTDCMESNDEVDDFFGWSLNNTLNPLNDIEYADAKLSDWGIASTGTLVVNGITADVTTTTVQVTNMPSSTFAQAVSNGDYVQMSFVTGLETAQISLDRLRSAWYSPSNGDSFYSTTMMSVGPTTTWQTLNTDMFHTDDGSIYAIFDHHIGSSIPLISNTEYRFRFYLYGQIDDSPESYSVFDDIYFYIHACRSGDFDVDGVPDHLDLDSDNDGLFDVLEAGGNDPDFDGIIGTGAITDTDGDGWSDITDPDNGGTPLADGDQDGDGLQNRIDLDSDDDGCTDVIEAGFPDSDGDGELGGLVPPAVDQAGKVTSGGL
jgi:hypothetical protein